VVRVFGVAADGHLQEFNDTRNPLCKDRALLCLDAEFSEIAKAPLLLQEGFACEVTVAETQLSFLLQ